MGCRHDSGRDAGRPRVRGHRGGGGIGGAHAPLRRSRPHLLHTRLRHLRVLPPGALQRLQGDDGRRHPPQRDRLVGHLPRRPGRARARALRRRQLLPDSGRRERRAGGHRGTRRHRRRAGPDRLGVRQRRRRRLLLAREPTAVAAGRALVLAGRGAGRLRLERPRAGPGCARQELPAAVGRSAGGATVVARVRLLPRRPPLLAARRAAEHRRASRRSWGSGIALQARPAPLRYRCGSARSLVYDSPRTRTQNQR